MPLTSCRECGKQVSTEATSCPHCGVPTPGSTASPISPQPTTMSSPFQKPHQPSPGPAQAATAPANTPQHANIVVVRSQKSRGLYIILGLFLGCLGIHNFYAGYYGRGAAQLLITIVLGWFIVGLIITAVWALFDICTIKQDGAGEAMT